MMIRKIRWNLIILQRLTSIKLDLWFWEIKFDFWLFFNLNIEWIEGWFEDSYWFVTSWNSLNHLVSFWPPNCFLIGYQENQHPPLIFSGFFYLQMIYKWFIKEEMFRIYLLNHNKIYIANVIYKDLFQYQLSWNFGFIISQVLFFILGWDCWKNICYLIISLIFLQQFSLKNY